MTTSVRKSGLTVHHASASRWAMGFLLLVVLVAVSAPWLAPYGANEQDYSAVGAGPSVAHWLGVDQLGRDTLSRLMYGAQVSCLAAVVAVGVAAVIGVPLGFASGYLGGVTDRVTLRLVDTIMAIPGVILAICIVAALGSGLVTAMVAVGLVMIPSYVRLVRAPVISVRSRLYVDAARTFGVSTMRTVARHILPNSVQPAIVLTAQLAGTAILIEAGLSFLGLGTPPPAPSWGGMLSEAAKQSIGLTIQVLVPGLMITLTVLSFNVVGDSLRDWLDVRRRTSGGEPARRSTSTRMNKKKAGRQDG